MPDRKHDSPKEMVKRLLESPAYVRAYEDIEFLNTDDARPIRLQTELLKPELILRHEKIASTIVVFGGTRIVEPVKAKARVRRLENKLKKNPRDVGIKRDLKVARAIESKSHYYEAARRFANIASSECVLYDDHQYVIVTGGGPGVMEAANRGAWEAGAKSIGMNISIPDEQVPNPYISPELCFQFHYFALRKMHFLLRAKALVAFPGGYGTLDELFEALTLVQTEEVRALPIILYGTEYWKKLINFQFLVDEGTIDPEDLQLFQYSDDPLDAWNRIKRFYQERNHKR